METHPREAELDARFMGLALAQARAARDAGEVPVGAVVVLDGELLAAERNRVRAQRDPTAHAELLALQAALRKLSEHRSGHERLEGATVYCTLEPCFMCSGALLHMRVARVLFGARDPKFGGCVSLGSVLTDVRSNHRCTLEEGLEGDASRALLQDFFRARR